MAITFSLGPRLKLRMPFLTCILLSNPNGLHRPFYVHHLPFRLCKYSRHILYFLPSMHHFLKFVHHFLDTTLLFLSPLAIIFQNTSQPVPCPVFAKGQPEFLLPWMCVPRTVCSCIQFTFFFHHIYFNLPLSLEHRVQMTYVCKEIRGRPT